MTNKFSHFFKVGGFHYPAWCHVLAGLVLLGAMLLGGPSGAWAGLAVPTAKDRAQGDTLFGQAMTAYQGGDYPGALRLLEQADALKPDQADAWNLRGVIYLKQKAYDKADAAFARAVAIDPTLWAAQFNLAEVSFQQKKFARARKVFDGLLAQTDRYKTGNKWELVLYKAFLCDLLSGDEAGARKKLAKLPATGGATPAVFYAQAALAFSRKDAAGANKLLAGAQAAYPAALNGMFSTALETAGWQAPAMMANISLPGASAAPAVPVDPATAAAMSAAGLTNPASVPPPGASRPAGPRPAATVDPRLVAVAYDPLPAGPGTVQGSTPAVGKSRRPGKETPAAPPVAAEPAATPPPSPFDHDGLLLGLD